MSLRSIIRLVVAILLLPLCYAMAVAFGSVVGKGVGGFGGMAYNTWALLIGGASYVGVFALLHRTPIAGTFSRGTVERTWGTITGIKRPVAETEEEYASALVDSKGRAVPLWRVLLPYLIPLYTLIALAALWIVQLISGWKMPELAFYLVGLTYTAHIFMVVKSIRERSADLRAAGLIFTLVCIFLANIEVLMLVSVLLGGEWLSAWVAFNETVWVGSRNPYGQAYKWLVSLVR